MPEPADAQVHLGPSGPEDLDVDELQSHFEAIIELLGYGEETDNSHTVATPGRAARAWRDLTIGKDFNATVFKNVDIDQMVVCQDIQFHSLCAHHMLPFFGKAHIAYIPDSTLIGLSKFARIVGHFARGLTVQEELTKDVSDYLEEILEPKGAAVVLQGHHLCMAMRGVEETSHLTTTSAMTGVFLDNTKQSREEFFNIVGIGRRS